MNASDQLHVAADGEAIDASIGQPPDALGSLHAYQDQWHERALCRGYDVAMFFPESGESSDAAIAVCANCPVRRECLKYALGRREPHGVWGGTSEDERRILLELSPPLPQYHSPRRSALAATSRVRHQIASRPLTGTRHAHMHGDAASVATPRLLLVDDNEAVRKLVADMLEDEGVKVVAQGATGLEAVDFATSLDVNVVLMDVKMPGMDGIEATRSIRALRPDIQVVILTMFDGDRQRGAALEAGAFAYLRKGEPLSSVARIIREACEARRG